MLVRRSCGRLIWIWSCFLIRFGVAAGFTRYRRLGDRLIVGDGETWPTDQGTGYPFNKWFGLRVGDATETAAGGW